MDGVPPPTLWAREVTALARSGDASRALVDDGGEKLGETWRHVKNVARDESKHFDLMDLVRNARREDTYQFPVPGWPSLLRAVSPAMPDLPAMVRDRYRACQTMCFCGVFPEIRRAWASIDNSLFLWRYDRAGDVPIEYAGEEQAICCVALARPRPGVFLSAIRHVLVLATTVEIVLLGVCTGPGKGGGGGGGGDAFETLSLQPMPLYALPSDNVIMTCAAASSSGRIFLGGADGHVYELSYTAGDTWRTRRRVSKQRLTGGLASALPSFLPSFLFGPPTPLDRLVVDDERHILYSLAADSALQAFDLGPHGDEPARRAAELHDFLAEVSRLPTGRSVFSLGEDRRGAAVKHLAVIPMSESWKVHLMAVTSNGRRAYFTTNPLVRAGSSWGGGGGGGGRDGRLSTIPGHLDPRTARPSVLVAVDARGPLPQAPVAGARVSTDPSGRVMDVTAALYGLNTLLLAESAGPDGRATKLLAAARNHTLPPPSVNVHFSSGAAGLREVVSEFDQLLPGEATAVGCLPQASLLGPEVSPGGPWGAVQDELVAQMFTAPPQLVVVSTAGVLELERRRPADVLQALLAERAPEKLQQFFDAYGAPEAAAMCLLLATDERQSARIAAEAAAALDNPLLVGQPTMPEEGSGGADAAANAGAAGGGIYMGAAVNPNPEPEWSGAHRGLALYVSRLLAPVWDVRLITPSSSNASVWKARLSDKTMAALEHKLRALERFLGEAAARRKSRGFKATGGAGAADGLQAAAAAGAGAGGGGGGAAGGAGGLFGGGGGGYLNDGTSRLLNAGGGGGGGGATTPGGASGVGGVGGIAVGGAGAAGAAAAAADAPFAKRQRLWNAFVMEEQRNHAVRLLASKAAQALLLLRTVSAANVNRLVNRLDADGRRALKELNFRDLVLESGSGPPLAAQLVAALVADQLEAGGAGGAGGGAGGGAAPLPGGVAELAAALQAGAPAYFRQQDRTFYEATARLKAAERPGASASERDAAARDALGGLLRVPQCVSLPQMVGRLAALRQYAGVVELVLRCAALADPHRLAWRHGSGADAAAARAARDRCYAPLLALLRGLLGAPGSAPPTALPAAAATTTTAAPAAAASADPVPLTRAECRAAKDAVVQVVLRSDDQYLVTELFSTLVDAGADEDLLSHPSAALELYLRTEGGLAGGGAGSAGAGGGAGAGAVGGGAGGLGAAAVAAPPGRLLGGQVGPLGARQVRHLELLARLYIAGGAYAAAAGVYRALAERRSGPGDAAVSLEQRLDALQSALLQARSVGDEQLTEGLRGGVTVMALQLSIAQQLQARLDALRAATTAATTGGGGGLRRQQPPPPGAEAAAGLPEGVTREQLEGQLRELRAAALDVSELYNAYAQPYELWAACLEICHFAGNAPAEYVRQLWDLLLKQAWEGGGSAAGAAGADDGDDGGESIDARLERCCAAVEQLGVRFYPNEGSLPLAHVALRLEAAAAGLWPALTAGGGGGAARDASRVVRCLRAVLAPAAGDNASGVIAGVYEQLLSRRGALLDGGVAGAGVVLGGGGGSGGGDGAASAALRLGLLRSLAAHCRIVREEELVPNLPGQPDHGFPSRFIGRAQQAAALADLAERCAGEARALGGGAVAEELAGEFDRVAAQLAAGGAR